MRSSSQDPVHAVAAERQRLDKWLWFARVVKTRKQAVRLVEHGYVRIDARRAGVPAKSVGPGDVLTIALERDVRVLRIRAIAERRGPPRDAQLLFEDLAAEDLTAKVRPNSSPGICPPDAAGAEGRGKLKPSYVGCLPKRHKGDSNLRLIARGPSRTEGSRGGME
jgi:ribosome-associated heat shock protein Hsp15